MPGQALHRGQTPAHMSAKPTLKARYNPPNPAENASFPPSRRGQTTTKPPQFPVKNPPIPRQNRASTALQPHFARAWPTLPAAKWHRNHHFPPPMQHHNSPAKPQETTRKPQTARKNRARTDNENRAPDCPGTAGFLGAGSAEDVLAFALSRRRPGNWKNRPRRLGTSKIPGRGRWTLLRRRRGDFGDTPALTALWLDRRGASRQAKAPSPSRCPRSSAGALHMPAYPPLTPDALWRDQTRNHTTAAGRSKKRCKASPEYAISAAGTIHRPQPRRPDMVTIATTQKPQGQSHHLHMSHPAALPPWLVVSP